MALVATILGCGSSGGVPRVGTGWGACDPSEPRNRRRRCSLFVSRSHSAGETAVLFDTSPDLREQLLDAEIRHLDAVIFTHEHADHTHGIDDLRPLVIHMRRRIPVYMDEKTTKILEERFDYCFRTPEGSGYPPILESQPIRDDTAVQIEGEGGTISARPFRMIHGSTDTLGFRIHDFAYAPDVSTMPEAAEAQLHGLETLVIDALRHNPHPTHFNVTDALNLIERVRPSHAVLTNLHTDLDYRELARQLPEHVEPAYDGMRIAISQ